MEWNMSAIWIQQLYEKMDPAGSRQYIHELKVQRELEAGDQQHG